MSNIKEQIRQEIERRKGKSYYSAMIELLNIIEVAQAQGGDGLVDYPSYKKGYFDGRRDEKEQMMKDSEEDALLLERAWLTLDGFGHEELAGRLRQFAERKGLTWK